MDLISPSLKKMLLLALCTGMSLNAVFGMLTEESISFGLFALITLWLAGRNLYDLYLSEPLEENGPLCIAISFLIGIFGHSAYARAVYPDIGSNFIHLMLCLGLSAYLCFKLAGQQATTPAADNNA